MQKSLLKKNVGKMRLFPPVRDNDHLSIDHKGPIYPATEDGNLYITSIMDLFTGKVWSYPAKRIDAYESAKRLLMHTTEYGVPLRITSDQGSDFLSEVVKHYCNISGAKKLKTTSYYPQGNGAIERWHRTLNAALRVIAAENEIDFQANAGWEPYLAQIVSQHNNTKSRRTGFSPNDFYGGGRPFRSPITHLTDLKLRNPRTKAMRDWHELITNYKRIATELGRLRLDEYNRKRKELYDRNREDATFKIDDLVIRYKGQQQGTEGKLCSRWHGPYIVRKIYNDGINYVLAEVGNEAHIVHTNVHKIRRYYLRERQPLRRGATVKILRKNYQVVEVLDEGYKVQRLRPLPEGGYAPDSRPPFFIRNMKPTVLDQDSSDDDDGKEDEHDTKMHGGGDQEMSPPVRPPMPATDTTNVRDSSMIDLGQRVPVKLELNQDLADDQSMQSLDLDRYQPKNDEADARSTATTVVYTPPSQLLDEDDIKIHLPFGQANESNDPNQPDWVVRDGRGGWKRVPPVPGQIPGEAYGVTDQNQKYCDEFLGRDNERWEVDQLSDKMADVELNPSRHVSELHSDALGSLADYDSVVDKWEVDKASEHSTVHDEDDEKGETIGTDGQVRAPLDEQDLHDYSFALTDDEAEDEARTQAIDPDFDNQESVQDAVSTQPQVVPSQVKSEAEESHSDDDDDLRISKDEPTTPPSRAKSKRQAASTARAPNPYLRISLEAREQQKQSRNERAQKRLQRSSEQSNDETVESPPKRRRVLSPRVFAFSFVVNTEDEDSSRTY